MAGCWCHCAGWCGAGKNQGLKAFCIDPRILCPPPLHRTFAPLAPALASPEPQPGPATGAKSRRKNFLPSEEESGAGVPGPACLLIDCDGSRCANERRHFLCDTGPRVGIRPIRTFFLAAWVGLGGTCLVHCVAKTMDKTQAIGNVSGMFCFR